MEHLGKFSSLSIYGDLFPVWNENRIQLSLSTKNSESFVIYL